MDDVPPAAGGDTKTCPYCAETIKAAAVVCRYCGRELTAIAVTKPVAAYTPPPPAPSKYDPPVYTKEKRKGGGCVKTAGVAFLVLLGLVILSTLVRSPTSRTSRTATVGTSAASTPVAVAVGSNTRKVAPTEMPTTVPTETPVPLRKIGEDVVLGKLRWNVVAAADAGQKLTSDNQFIDDATTGGRFVRVAFDIENLDNERRSFLGVDLADAQGRTFGAFDNSYIFVEDDRRCIMQVLQPNIPQTCEVIFEVPANATGLMLKITSGEVFGASEDYVDLGL